MKTYEIRRVIRLLPLFLLLLLLGAPMRPWAMAGVYSGYVAAEGRFFTENPQFDGQRDSPAFSGVLAPEFALSTDAGSHQFKIFPYMRIDSVDDDRTHLDLREAYWRYSCASFELLIGINKVFWGVAESNHLVDIINQTDSVEDVDQEDKLGQPMVMIATQRDWGEIQIFFMPFFRERTYPGTHGRLRTPLVISENTRYESGAEEYHLDVAIRYAHYAGDWDFGASYFHGTGREPVLQLNNRWDRLVARYEIIGQGGLDVQFTREAWLWKFETIFRQGQGRRFAALVGGFEYTCYQLFGSAADLGILMEYNWDGREKRKAPPAFFDNDLFGGLRLALNDPQDTQALAGTVIDVESGSTFYSVEAQRRIGDSLVAQLHARFFSNIDADAPEKVLETDDFINISFQYHF